jgi:hypothetical protein
MVNPAGWPLLLSSPARSTTTMGSPFLRRLFAARMGLAHTPPTSVQDLLRTSRAHHCINALQTQNLVVPAKQAGIKSGFAGCSRCL